MRETEEVRLQQYRKLLLLLELQRRTLAHAGTPVSVLETFSILLKHLNRLPQSDVLKMFDQGLSKRKKTRAVSVPSPDELNSLSLDELEKLASDESTPRKVLEAIAVSRFNFPHGSLRSLSNIKTLKEKIKTRIENERAHQAISSVARQSRG